MSLIHFIIGFFILKGILVWPFYYSLKWKPLVVGFLLALTEAPFLELLYHDTDINFWIPFFFLIVFDWMVFYFVLQKVWWKAIIPAFLYNLIGFILFTLVNA